jgi:hypothetical protein
MKEKIKIICLIIITVAISISAWAYIQKEIIYLNAYKDCLKSFGSENTQRTSWVCISILNGRGQ